MGLKAMIDIIVTVVACFIGFGLGYWLCKIQSADIVDSLVIYSLSQEEVIKQLDKIKVKQLELIQAYQERVAELEAIE